MLLRMERTYFRFLTTEDEKALFEIYSDKDAMQYRTTLPFETLEDVKIYLQQVEKENALGKKFRCGFVHRETLQLMGTAVYTLVDDTSAEIGFSIGRAFWKGGYGTEGTWGLIELIKQQHPQVKRILAVAQTANEKSVRMINRMNFSFIEEKENKSYFEYFL
ncbi:GNAT family N-acetyltransferase [Myroides sp. WP-1]|uniref:GNAT family N-acetyltransferase n=1 Tax=Myroides sp. WP-1 TaxID=2759944 RepID=UPI0015FB5DC7|nr:GNAT family N-acetyltransferase [Myroides sp. WP-1]MBB1140769.1 GNAT family N-acetyltransferase [Myroides sp. WP-1]